MLNIFIMILKILIPLLVCMLILINKNLKENELIYIIREEELKDTYDMHEHTFDSIFNTYSGKEIVIKYWHEDGLCILIK